MASNYPPGVTGSEPQIVGTDQQNEWVAVLHHERILLSACLASRHADCIGRTFPTSTCDDTSSIVDVWLRTCLCLCHLKY
jgi:hypothetical protein